jgi:signal transduction histidine kinase/ActR/RegA family two-component response regulator
MAFNPNRRLKFAICLLAACVVATLAVLRGVDLWWRHDQILKAGERRASNLALILAAHLRETFEAADASLRQLAIHGRRIGGAKAAADEWAAMLTAAKAGLTGIGSLSVTDSAGTIRHSTIPFIVGQSRREHYLTRLLSSESHDVLVADTPFRSLTSGQMVIPLGRRLTRPDGGFDGMIVATFIPDELRGFFQTVDVGRRGVVWVFHLDGVVLFREPSDVNPIGEVATGNPIFEAARKVASPGTLRGKDRADGPDLLSAFQPLRDPPLVVAVSLSEAEILSEWRREVMVSAGALALLGLTLMATLLLLLRQIDARTAAEQALSRAQRLESIGQLTGGVAHDFNNILTVILGNADLLKDGEADPASEEAAQEIDQIEQAARRGAELTRRLLAFARRQPLQPRIVDLNELVGQLQPMLARLLGEDVTLKINLGSAPCLADVDPIQVETALMNLCVNARDAMPQGGLLIVESGMTEFDESYARTNPDVAPGRYVMISVNDTGVGIPPENIARVIEPFFTTKAPGKGTGLGLSMVYGFVKQSGGHLKLYSEVGRGTAVKVYFPEAAGTVAARTEEAAVEERGAGEIILLVEDNDGVRRLAARLLGDLGYRVIAAADGPAALALARDQPRIDLLLTDAVLPEGMTGRQVAEELARQRPGVPVLYTSGYSQEIAEHRGQVDPGFRLLSKPFDRGQLAKAVRAALQRGRPEARSPVAGHT